MTPLEQLPSEGDARLENDRLLGVGRTGRRSTGAGNKINNEVINIRQCLVNMAVLHLLPPGDHQTF